MQRIMARRADDEVEACRTAQGMELAGAIVFSITHNGMHQPLGALIPSSRFIVWAKVNGEDHINAVDKAISKELRK